MAQATWEKPADTALPGAKPTFSPERLKFLIGGLLILGAVAVLIITSTISGAQYFISVNQIKSDPAYVGQTVRVTGAVLGDTIVYDGENLVLDFTIVAIPDQYGDLADALEGAVNNPDAQRLQVHLENEVKPDLLVHRAQAILTGHLGEDGIFYADELLLKCPSRFIEGGPGHADLTLTPQA